MNSFFNSDTAKPQATAGQPEAPGAASAANQPAQMIAPLWHLALVVMLLAAMGLRSYYAGGLLGPAVSSNIYRYLTTMVLEWGLVGVVFLGIRSSGTTMRQLIGGNWSKAKWFFRDLGIALAFLVGSILVLQVIARLLHLGPPANVAKFLPHTVLEKSVWVLLSLTAGICEEFISRGYMQRQFTALLKSAPAAITLQGVIFGLAHIYQGWGHVLLIVLLGCMLGWLAHWRKTLRPGILSHFLQDAVGGFAGG